ncbi:5-formyltetrahydrofolate cyclo-ligase [uncultured Alsobacter sp.]|uniref:5-formyltetrahydrofolate cyclo-ligase n=1 Tax=uncultured Alsobacter sp. TaxID=1748258 RepID=UPI0025CCB305|nr:5-formyltetrahydrofolate cyclo-ligase [uncultured Alsobacter sp.]
MGKAALRTTALARRDAFDAAFRDEAAKAVASRIAALAGAMPPGPVSAFWPIRSEIDPRPALSLLASAGRTAALPRVTPRGLQFCAWSAGDPLVKAGFGLSEPGPEAPIVRPATMLVPLAAFDRRGHRIGYGAGYYDRAIAACQADGAPLLTIGLAFSCQEVEAVPDEAHDKPLDFLVTERETIRFRAP